MTTTRTKKADLSRCLTWLALLLSGVVTAVTKLALRLKAALRAGKTDQRHSVIPTADGIRAGGGQDSPDRHPDSCPANSEKGGPGLALLATAITREILLHHDSDARLVVNNGNREWLMKSKHLGLVGRIVISPDLRLVWGFRGLTALSDDEQRVTGEAFSHENRCHPANRWSTSASLVTFVGSMQLRGDGQNGLRHLRRHLFRRIETVEHWILRRVRQGSLRLETVVGSQASGIQAAAGV